MYKSVVFVVSMLGHLSSGGPLESPSSEFTKFFGSRIVGGNQADEDKAPHMVALVVGHQWQSFVCGGSIITPVHMLTAAHCVMITWTGELLDTFHAMVSSNTWHAGIVVELKEHRLHPEYDSWNIKNDVAVLTARNKIKMNDLVAPIPLDFGYVGGGEKCYVTGWGTDRLWGSTPDKLQYLYVETLCPEACARQMKEVGGAGGGQPPPVHPTLEICTFHSHGHGMCHGDSGSALVSKKKKKQIGIVSWGSPCAVGAPDVYARVASAKGFILDIIH